jgi:hypothetical protein
MPASHIATSISGVFQSTRATSVQVGRKAVAGFVVVVVGGSLGAISIIGAVATAVAEAISCRVEISSGNDSGAGASPVGKSVSSMISSLLATVLFGAAAKSARAVLGASSTVECVALVS